jgi:uncharacterized membrane protein
VSSGALFIAVFLACMVEAVEAATIVLAAGASRDWRSAVSGLVTGLVVLVIIVGVVGSAISNIPLRALRLVIGGLLLVFGMQWVRKAILRASGYKALHDETEIYRKQVDAAQHAPTETRWAVADWYAFTLAFKGVVLEGLEVAFIVLTFGTNEHDVPLAAAAAAAALAVVAVLGLAMRAPLARVPENTMKFVVGVMLTSFGMFWAGEGAGARWPGSDAALLVIIPVVALLAVVSTAFLRYAVTPAAEESISGAIGGAT